jgi:hypothetical protein
MDEIYGAAVIEVLKDNYLTMIDPHGAHTGQVMVRSEWEAVMERSDEAGLAASATSRDQAG